MPTLKQQNVHSTHWKHPPPPSPIHHQHCKPWNRWFSIVLISPRDSGGWLATALAGQRTIPNALHVIPSLCSKPNGPGQNANPKTGHSGPPSGRWKKTPYTMVVRCPTYMRHPTLWYSISNSQGFQALDWEVGQVVTKITDSRWYSRGLVTNLRTSQPPYIRQNLRHSR